MRVSKVESDYSGQVCWQKNNCFEKKTELILLHMFKKVDLGRAVLGLQNPRRKVLSRKVFFTNRDNNATCRLFSLESLIPM